MTDTKVAGLPASQSGLIVALDVGSSTEALDLAGTLSPVTRFFKIGSVLFSLEGPKLVRAMAADGYQVFLDLKFHDIPDVVAGAVRHAAQLGVSMLTVHASGGEAMLRAAAHTLQELPAPRPILLAVTVLTSFSPESWRQVFPQSDLRDSVRHLAALAQRSGIDGLVCSPEELRLLAGSPLKKVVPGVRPAGDAKGDQQRVQTPAQAVAAGADYLVVGRPITRASNPLQVARAIVEEMRATNPRAVS